jgi:hypothetical protein
MGAIDGLLIGWIGGLALGLIVSWRQFDGAYSRAYNLGVKHGREMAEIEQWGADMREAINIRRYEEARDAD